MVARSTLCGWTPNPTEVRALLDDKTFTSVTRWAAEYTRNLTPRGGLPMRRANPDEYILKSPEPWQQPIDLPDYDIDWSELRDQPPVLLYEALFHFLKHWKRGAQGIGDCVSWGWELACTIAAAVQAFNSRGEFAFSGEYATEPIYGGSRVEARGKKRGGYSDGSYGGAAAKWVTIWGALLRQNYSHVNGANKEYDLTSYSSDKAKEWGNYGCGGEDDADKLDLHAKEFPVRHAVLCTTFDQSALAIANGYPVAVCSGYGFGSRGAGGWLQRKGSWSHCMLFCGVRFDKPGLLLANSWGNSWGDKMQHYPESMPGEFKKCSGWVSRDDVNGMLRGEDSFAVGQLELKRQPLVWLDVVQGLGLGRTRRSKKSLFAAA